MKEVISIKFNPVTSQKLHVQIYNQILAEIQKGSFKIGDKLPSERELCEQFGVSRSTIRQAFSALELTGIIYSRQGEGVYVKSTQSTVESTRSQSMLESISPEDIIEARLSLEPLIIRYAAERATDEDIENLMRTIKQMEEETKAGTYVLETDERLHREIARASGNDLFIIFMDSITNAMRQQEMWQFILDRTVTRPDYREVHFQEHKQLIEAIREHDPVKAERLMTMHMQKLYERYWKVE